MPTTKNHESRPSAEEYLEFLCDHAGVGLGTITDQDIGEGVLDPDFNSQLIAIRSVLARNHEVEERVSAEIQQLEAEIRNRGGDSWMDYRRLSSLHSSTFLEAAHSMAAVGLIAPLVESLFDRAFRYLKEEAGDSYASESDHERWHLDDPWDHRFVWKSGRRDRGIVKGILQLAEAIDLKKDLPDDLEKTLSVLFAYRNKMFHCGLEWPDDELRDDLTDFANEIASKGWKDCFTRAESGGKPRFFCLSREFTEHCLETVDGTIEGIGAHVRRVLWAGEPSDQR